MLKKILKKIIPKRVLLFYHKVLSYLSAFIYNYPSNKMIVIGVTGTAGKSTVVNLIAKILEQAGFMCGLASTFNFKIGNKEIINKTRMTMQGRFNLQKLLKKMVISGCKYAIIETTSEGIIQSRHLGINYDVVVFTNLFPEHIESHGSIEKYRQAKEQIFKHLSKNKHKIINHKKIKKIIIANSDDKNSKYFLQYNADKKYGYGLDLDLENVNKQVKSVKAENIKLISTGSEFSINNIHFSLNLLGRFSISNALGAVCVAISQGIDLSVCKNTFKNIQTVSGRMEVVNKNPLIIIDYAHTPESLEKVYKTVLGIKSDNACKIICVFGSAGGGRDKWKRPVLGKIAQKYCDYLIITNEDPYDEIPEKIIEQIISGINNSDLLIKNNKLYRILDRYKAIKKAINISGKNDIVVITGKGSEECIMGACGRKIEWNDKKVVKKILNTD